MTSKITDLYLYLAKRDKSGIRILVKLKSRPQLPTRLNDVSILHLPEGWESEIKQTIYESRMLWEPWIESSESFDEFKTSLKKRGFSNLPSISNPEVLLESILINSSFLPKKNTMLRKKT